MDIHEFDIFWNKYFNDLKRYALSLTKKKDLVGGLINDTYVKAKNNLHLYRQDENFIGWLYVIMRNAHRNYLKHEKRYADFELCENCDSVYHTDSDIEYEQLMVLVKSLPTELYVVFNLYSSGYKYNEIAELLDIPIGTVKSRIHIAREWLKKRIISEYKS